MGSQSKVLSNISPIQTSLSARPAIPAVLHNKVVDVKLLTGQALELFLDELSTLVADIFLGYDRNHLAREFQATNLVSAKVLNSRQSIAFL